MSVDLAPTRAGSLRLHHPVVVAAGGAGLASELLEHVAGSGLTPGAVVTRGISLSARRGHPGPRMVPLTDGLLSSVGPDGPGLETVLRRHGPRWAASEVPVVVSVFADTADELAALARTVDMHAEVAGVELDLSCPDRGRGGLPIGLDVEATEMATVAVRAATDLPLLVKLTPSAPDVRAIARAAVAAGADAISAIGRLPALTLDPGRGRAALGSAYGGLSGPLLKPVGLRVVYEVAQVVRVPIVGIGGVCDLDDVLDYLAAGATAVGLATAALADPTLPGRLGAQLEAWCARQGVNDLRELIGMALPPRRDRGSLALRPYRS